MELHCAAGPPISVFCADAPRTRIAFSDLAYVAAFVARVVKIILLIGGYFWKLDPGPVWHTVTICPTHACNIPTGPHPHRIREIDPDPGCIIHSR